MTKFSEANLFGMTVRESANDGSDFTNPDADYRRLFLGEDGLLHLKDSSGTVTDIGSGSLSDHTHAATGSGSNGGGATLAPTTFTFPTGSNPTQTTEGQAAWDTDDDTLKVGTGAATKEIGYLGSTTPAATGSAAAGSSKETSRADHVHASSGGGGLSYPIDTVALNGTYGDDFDGASLNGRWTRHVQGSGEESYQVGPGGSALRVTYSTGAASRYIYQTAPNGTNETWATCLAIRQSATSGEMFSLLMVDTSGNGVAIMVYNNARIVLLANVASHAYSSVGQQIVIPAVYYEAGQRLWLQLRKASGVYYGTASFNGETYMPELSFTPSSFTPARVGVGRILGTNADDVVDYFRFNKTA